ncbi:DUF2459 domain-containing protein [Erythrobacter sp.]|uniref:DUF2459 domain-containing protein n=1 Tax=Erythrobacter sp. TaxID=1042 RepID=UPI003C7388EF
MAADRAKAFRILRWVAAILLAPVILFALAAWIGSSIPRNGDWIEPDPSDGRTIPILIGHNGIHTEIVMPLVSPEMDWRPVFPARDIAAAFRPYTHVAVSWGERAFFLETPEWSDLDPITAIDAMTGGEGIVHVAHYVRPATSQDYRILHLRPSEYAALVRDIAMQLDPAETREILPGYDRYDVFYTARGRYHIGNTCNQWTGDRLAAAGIAIGQWTPMAGGVMKWVPHP